MSFQVHMNMTPHSIVLWAAASRICVIHLTFLWNAVEFLRHSCASFDKFFTMFIQYGNGRVEGEGKPAGICVVIALC